MKLTGWLALAVLSAAAATASAQVDVEGEGVKVSEGTMLKPKAGVDMGIVSNVFFEDEANDPQTSAILRVFAEFGWASVPAKGRGAADTKDEGDSDEQGSEAIAFSLTGGFRYDSYLSSEDTVSEQGGLAVRFLGSVELRPRSTVSFFAQDSFVRDTRPTNFESAGNLNRDLNTLRLETRYRPAGRTLHGRIGYQNTIDVFETKGVGFADRIQHTVSVRADWRYLPITVFWLEASQGLFGPLRSSGSAYKRTSYPLRARIGGSSAFTPLTTLSVSVGWASGFYEVGPTYNGVIAAAEFGYRYSPLGRLLLSASRDFTDSVNANFYGEWRFGARVEQQVGPFLGKAGAGFRLRTYEGVSEQVMGDPTRDDAILHADVGAYYYYRQWLAVAAEYDLASVSTDYRYGELMDDPSYVRQVVTLGVHGAF